MFPIGAFSRLAQLSIRVLRHYDEIGLLKPAHTDRSSGYRYYASEQLADAHRIVALKELGLTLEQTRRVMTERLSAEAVAGMLRLEKLRAEQARAAAERRLRDLDRRLAELTETGRLSDVDVVEKSVGATPYLAYRATVETVDAAYALMKEVSAFGERFGLRAPLIAIGHDAFFDTENLDIELGFGVASPTGVDLGGGRHMNVRELEAVERMLSVVYVGAEEDGHRHCLGAVARWLERHDCELAGPVREIVHGAGRDARPTVEIQHPIAARTRHASG